MKKIFLFLVILAVGITTAFLVFAYQAERASVAEFEILGGDKPSEDSPEGSFMETWKRPAGPLRVGLQVGHWKADELPEELKRIRERGGGTRGGGKEEWEVNLDIVNKTAKLLEVEGIAVDILPATVPPKYFADVFVAVHADGSSSSKVSGFKAASPWRDLSGEAHKLVEIIETTYQDITGLTIDPNVTRNMRGYYAFNWRRHTHAIHPMTTAVILETGFLTSTKDQKILINNSDLAAQAIAEALLIFLEVG